MDRGLGGKAPIEEGSILVCVCVFVCGEWNFFFFIILL